MRSLKTVISLVASSWLLLCGAVYGGERSAELSISTVKGTSGTRYHLYGKGAGLYISWNRERPSKSDKAIKLCIPAAFTSTTGTVVGIFAVNGEVGNREQISKSIGGILKIVDGEFKIFPSDKGERFTQRFIDSLKTERASLFQQFQLVENGVASKFKDKRHFQMRAIGKFASRLEAVIESDSAIDFKTFNSDLVGMGVKDAIYTDMGAWDEGWYRNPKTSKVVPIGKDRSKTQKQTNWITFVSHRESRNAH